MIEREPAKRIPKSLGVERKLLGAYTLSDIGVALFPAVIIVLIVQLVVPASASVAGYTVQTLTLPFAGVAIFAGALLVYATPNHISSLAWLVSIGQFYLSPSRETHAEATDHHQIRRVYPEQNVIERQDGAFIGIVRVSPPSMALATADEWTAKTTSFQDFLNTTVTFPIQIFSTTQPFPVDTYLDHYRGRLDDPDVKSNPQLKTLIERYIEWYERDLAARQMTIRDHYVVVPVTPDDVQFEQNSVFERLNGVPVIGVFVRGFAGPPSEARREAMFETIEKRLTRVESGLRGMDGCRATIVDASDATQVISEFWAGESLEYGDFEQALRTRPLVGERA